MKIIESKQFKDELRVIAFYIKKDKLSASIYFDNDEIRDMVYMGYTIVYEINTEKDTLELLSIFNQNLPDL